MFQVIEVMGEELVGGAGRPVGCDGGEGDLSLEEPVDD